MPIPQRQSASLCSTAASGGQSSDCAVDLYISCPFSAHFRSWTWCCIIAACLRTLLVSCTAPCVRLSVCLAACLPACLSVCLSVCLSHCVLTTQSLQLHQADLHHQHSSHRLHTPKCNASELTLTVQQLCVFKTLQSHAAYHNCELCVCDRSSRGECWIW